MELIEKVYRLKRINETLANILSEEERRKSFFQLHLENMNEMAHKGATESQIHRYMTDEVGFSHADLFQHWYRYGSTGTVDYIRALAAKAFNLTHKHNYSLGGLPIHPNILTNAAIKGMYVTKQNTRSSIGDDHIRVFRGLNIPHDLDPRKLDHHTMESWTTDHKTALRFSGKGDGKPVVCSGIIHPDHVVWSYNSRHKNGFILPEEELEGKEEHALLPQHLMELKYHD